MLNVSEVIAELTPERIRSSPSGISATFVVLNEKWGVKIFDSKRARDMSYDLQRRAAVFGLAPQVGEIFSLSDDEHCMICQVAKVIDSPSRLPHKEYESLMSSYKSRLTDLRNALIKTIQFDFTDWHLGNIGFIDGEMVCIDFGEAYGSGGQYNNSDSWGSYES